MDFDESLFALRSAAKEENIPLIIVRSGNGGVDFDFSECIPYTWTLDNGYKYGFHQQGEMFDHWEFTPEEDTLPPPPIKVYGTTVPAPTPKAGKARNIALTQVGVDTEWAGDDGAIFTKWAYGQAGISLPPTAEGQWELGQSGVCRSVDPLLEEDKPGDLLFNQNGVSLCIGGRQVIHALGDRVQIEDIDDLSYDFGIRPTVAAW